MPMLDLTPAAVQRYCGSRLLLTSQYSYVASHTQLTYKTYITNVTH